MRADIINPFVTGAIIVLKQLLPDSEIKKGELSIKKSFSFVGENVVSINFYGDLEGIIIFDMNEQTSINVAGIMNNTTFASYNELAQATINELANMIAGKAISYLREGGIYFDISTPIQTSIDSFAISNADTKILVIPIETKAGQIFIYVTTSEL